MFATPAECILKDFVEFGDTGCADHEHAPPHQRTHAAEHHAKLINRNGRYRRFRHANSLSKRKPTVWNLITPRNLPLSTSRSCSPSGACAPITSPSGGGSSAMARKWNDVCVGDSNQPRTVGGWMKPTSGLRASGYIYTGLWIPLGRPSTSFCRPSAMQRRPSAFSPKRWAEQTIRRRESSTPTSMPLTRR